MLNFKSNSLIHYIDFNSFKIKRSKRPLKNNGVGTTVLINFFGCIFRRSTTILAVGGFVDTCSSTRNHEGGVVPS